MNLMANKIFFSWWCHFDDDAYVNVEALLLLLSKFKPDTEKIYLGRRSIKKLIKV